MTILARLKEKAAKTGRKGVERAKAYREEQIQYRGEVKAVREKVTRSELEQEAAPIAKQYGISLEEAIIWLRSEKKKQQRAATVERMGTWGDDLGKGHKKTGRSRRVLRDNEDIEEYQEFLGGDSRFEEPTTTTRRKTKKSRTKRGEIMDAGIENVFFKSRRDSYEKPEMREPEHGESGMDNLFFKSYQKRDSKKRIRPEDEEDIGEGLMSAFIPRGR